MRFRRFENDDWFAIKNCMRMYSNEIDNAFFNYIQDGINITIIDGDEVVAVGGLVYVKEGIAEAWIKVSTEAKEKIKLLKMIKDGIGIMFDTFDSNTVIQAFVLSDFNKGERLAKYLGFYKTVDTIEIENERYDRYVKSYAKAIS